MIAYQIQPIRAESADFVASLRAARTRVVIVSRGGRIIAADEAARRMLNEIEQDRDGEQLPRKLDEVLCAWIRDGAVGDLAAAPIPGMLLRATQLSGAGSPIALLLEPMSTRENLGTAARRFGLSRRELDVVRLLLEGDSACEIAQRLGIAEYTVGDYIKRIFAKTRVRNRSEMIAKVLGWSPTHGVTPAETEH
ncbi:MAG TPA: LuxR C-terminal-related transcriptional regulator [Candidatus Elarobacter sp.]|nr:LuxR C-terminal-related transcriptional regulator [Candidatus Elarobacter sp.]